MEKKRSFLGFLASLFVVFFMANAFAAGYTCNDKKQYTSCNTNYYLNKSGVGNACLLCSSASNTTSTETKTRTCTDAEKTALHATACSTTSCQKRCNGNFTAGTGGTTVGTGTCSGCSSYADCTPRDPVATACITEYFFNDSQDVCDPCSGQRNYDELGRTTITGGTRIQTCTGYHTGGAGGTSGSEACTGCSASTYSCSCNSGYHVVGSGSSCTCAPNTIDLTCNPGFYVKKGTTTCSAECPVNKWCAGGKQTINSSGATADTGISGSCPSGFSAPVKSTSYTACFTSCVQTCSGEAPCTYANAKCLYDTSYEYTGIRKCQNAACTTTTSCSASGTCPVSSFVCNACYKKNAGGTGCIAETYTLTYQPGGGSGSVQSQLIQFQSTFTTKPSNTFTRGGYNFSSWGGSYPNANSTYTYTKCGNTTLTAQWTACNASNTAGACNCSSTQHPTGSGCANCSVSCSSVSGFTLGTYNVCNSQTDSICYRNCTTADVAGSATVSGTVTKGGTKTCKADTCDANHCKTTVGTCITKPANGTCNTGGGDPITCNAGYHLNTAKTDCLPNTYNVTYSCGAGTGTAPTANTATYDASYTPKSNTCSRANYAFSGWLVSGTSDTKQGNFIWKYTENKTFTAQWVPTKCPANQYLENAQCKTCPTSHPKSVEGNNNSINDCYKDCNASCTSPSSCPANSSGCTFDTTVKKPGTQKYNSSSCVINTGVNSACPVKTLACNRNYYTNDQVCSACTSLGNGQWNTSLSSNNSGPEGCYATCKKPCTPIQCPAHSTCTHGNEEKIGGIYYPSSECNVENFSCSVSITPDPGYEGCDDGVCDPIVAEITLNHEGGTSTVSKIYQKYSVGYSLTNFGATVTKIPVPTRATWGFNGYFTAATGGEKIVDANGNIIAANTKFLQKQNNTIYAQWTRLTRNCVVGKAYDGTNDVNCPAGKYCPGTGTAVIGTAGCATQCPADAAGGTVTSDVNSSVVTACRTVRSNQVLDDQTGRGDQTCGYNTSKSDYSASCTIKVTACNAGYYRQAENSTTCSSTEIGAYSPANDIKKYMCSALSGATADVTTAAKNSGAATLCYNPCGNVPIANGTRVPVNTKEFYNGTKIPACTYTTSCSDGYKPEGTTCVPNVYKITLNHNNGTPNSTIYLKFATGWYSNEAATNQITSVTVPSKGDGMAFSGYVSSNNDVIISANGTLTTNYNVFKSNATITAEWGARTPITCAAGTYYTGSGTSCTGCTAGNYCPGVETFEGVGSPRGINTCASLGGTYVHADGAPATVVTSKANAKASTDCYATNVAYTSASNKATGSQTCYFNPATTKYQDGKCEAIQVLSCVGGYYRVNASDTDCTAVGVGYYSAASQLTRTACPNLTTTNGVKTFSDTSEKVTECYLGNIWYQPVGGHSGHRRSCYHIDDASETDVSTGYSYNCNVSVIVTCDGGYYDDGNYKNSNGERDCIALTDKNSYSPAQSFFTSESAQPNQETPGSSTKTHSCPATKAIDNGTAKRVFQSTWTATDYAKCEYKAADCNEGYRPVTSGTTAKCVWADPNACPEGFYCPDNSDEPIECPRDNAGIVGTTEIGAKAVTSCFITYDPYAAFQNGTGSAICNYSTESSGYTRCHDIEAKTCNAGYYYRDAGANTCVEVVSGNYSPAPNTQQTPCPAGGNGSNQFAASWNACYKDCVISVAHSETVAAKETQVFGTSANSYAECSFNVTCKTGYTVANNNTAAPSCDANRYTVTLDKNGGAGDVAANIQCVFNSGACALPATTGLTRAGYSVGTKWCTERNGGGTCYNGGTTVTANISATGTATTLYAVWTPNVYTITLKHADANVAGAPATAYLKYATGWFADTSATLPLNKMSSVPQKTGSEFAGYVAADKTPLISADGTFQNTEAALTFTTANAEINVVWSAGNTVCEAGKYYAGTGSECAPCTDNHYCPGGRFATDAGKAGEYACRDNGMTATGSAASSETQCFKEDLPTYVATHGAGTQKCYFETESLSYVANCTDKFITTCDAGYWQSNKAPVQTAPDCEPVGNGYFSANNDTERTACPNGGTTAETNAATVQRCFKTGLDYAAVYGAGTQRCYYSNGEGAAAIYNRDCDTKTITSCRGGYWLDADVTMIDCSPVGYDYYSETDDVERHACEGGGKTNGTITSSPLSCFKDSETYVSAHGGGYRTCYYTSGTGDNALYETSCETPTLTYCGGGYYANIVLNRDDCIEVGYGFYSPAPTPSHLAESLERTACEEGATTSTPTSVSADACFVCPAGMVCDPITGEEPKTCAELTNGTHPNSDTGNTDVAGCWRDCAVATNAATMKGHDYYGLPSTCEIDNCKAGFTYNATTRTCDLCPEGSFCGGGEGSGDCPEGQNCDAPKSCSDLGDGSWEYSDIGATGPKSCYKKCEQYNLDGGIAVPVADRAYYANQCEFKGFDIDNNPCDIEDGVCVTTSCKPSFEMVNGKCVACNRDHALSYKNTGNCMVATCEPGWHPYGQSCEGDITECSAPNALRAEKQWDYKKNAYGICLIKQCEDGFHISSNACVSDIQDCTVEHGTGEKTWNHTTNTWGECVATYCDPGWTNDPYETNEPTKQCGHCKNKFGIKGELAVSGYSRGCTISACMYQGELYNLENNECNPICDVNGYEDETGTMKWNPATKKCERTCKEGYVMW